MARAKRSLSDLLDVEQRDEISSPPAPTPKILVAAPELPDDQPINDSSAVPATTDEPTVPPTVKETAEPGPAAPEVTALPAAPTSAPAVRPAERAARPRMASPVRSIKAAPEPPPLPLYLELTRKEARFRQDQLNDLTTLTRQLNRRRASTGERITDNTLIRVAVDMMLKVADSLDGVTEADLLQAVSAKLKR